MGRLLRDEKAMEFFQIMQSSLNPDLDVAESVNRAISCIAKEMHIGRVTVNLSVPMSNLRAPIDNVTRVLYQGKEEAGTEPILLNFSTGDGGKVVFFFYPIKNYVWSAEEALEVRIVGNEIYVAFSHDMMSGLLDRTLYIDLSVGIPNVTGFMKFAEDLYSLGELEQYDGFYLNIHNFKYVNKILSYTQANDVIKIYANKLTEAAEDGEMVARLGGDNFVVLVRRENVERFLAFVKGINIAYESEGQVKRFRFSATIGASHLDNLRNVGELMLRISVAYQIARKRESNAVVYYSEQLYKEVMQQKEIIAGFERALKKQEFVVYYQPKIKTADKTICGAEALVRWFKQGKLVSPMEFIPVLEKEGSICLLDFYVLDKVCDMLDRCRKADVPLTKVSVNFSRKHVEDADLVQKIVATIDKYNIPHRYLEIELTESEDFKDYAVLSGIINDLKEQDISTSIDDFGTGYSSLNMLKMTNVDLLKIDKSFVPLENEYAEKPRDVVMFESIARLAKELGISIIAEGVETRQQYEYLKSAGCDMIQGYYFDRPLPEADFWERMRIGQYL